MKKESFTTIILKPEDNHFLTNAGEVDIKNRVIATMIALGKNDAPENYVEISAEEAEAYREAQRIALEEETKRD